MMHHRPSDPDADRPCSCEESLQLKAAVLELENQLMRTGEEKVTAEAGRQYWRESSDSNLARAEKAEANYRFMVERAADQKLDGYRELGARAAAAEERADNAERRAIAAESDANVNRQERERLEARVRELSYELALMHAGKDATTREAVKAELEARALREQNESAERLLAQRAQDCEQYKDRVSKLEHERGELLRACGAAQDVAEGRDPIDAARSVKTDADNRLDEVVALRERIERAIAVLEDKSEVGFIAVSNALEALRDS